MKYIWKQIKMLIEKYQKVGDSLRLDPYSYIDTGGDFYEEKDNAKKPSL